MSNEIKDFTIKLRCNEAFYRVLVLMLRYAVKLGSLGGSRLLAIYFDGDGSDKVKELDISESVPESEKGILTPGRLKEIGPQWYKGDFLLDTDEVFNDIEED